MNRWALILLSVLACRGASFDPFGQPGATRRSQHQTIVSGVVRAECGTTFRRAPGVEVKLLRKDDTVLATTTTDRDGRFVLRSGALRQEDKRRQLRVEINGARTELPGEAWRNYEGEMVMSCEALEEHLATQTATASAPKQPKPKPPRRIKTGLQLNDPLMPKPR